MPNRQDVETVSAPFELLRRLILTLAVIVGVWLTWSTYEKPYLMISAPEPARAATARPRATAQSLLGPEAEKLWEARERKTPVVTVSGGDWTAFFAGAQKTFESGVPIPEWRGHLVGHDDEEVARRGKAGIRNLYFALEDPPFPSIAGELQVNRAFLLRLDGAGAPPLKAFVSPPYHPNLGSSSPFSLSYNPRKYAYPYGTTGLYVIAAGLLLYAVLPWPRRGPNVVYMGRIRVLLMDFLSIGVLFGVFFTLPFGIVGRSIGVVTEYWGLTAVFWLLAAMGGLLIYWAIYYAGFGVVVLPDRLRLVSFRGTREFRFAELEYVQPTAFLPPKWLVVLSFLAVFLGRGSAARAGQAGRAMLLASSQTGGLYLQARDGRTAFIWLTDQMGNVAVQNLERLTDSLEAAKVPRKEEERTLRGILPPTR
jgi:hypothetical protein